MEYPNIILKLSRNKSTTTTNNISVTRNSIANCSTDQQEKYIPVHLVRLIKSIIGRKTLETQIFTL